MNESIQVRGAREHNLKNIDVTIPRNKITVITGLSGSGKSSFAFNTVYAEGQRRYVESLSAYARNFLEQLSKPDVDSVVGLSPAIAIDQKTTSASPRSTVGTVTEVYDYLRLLFAKVGVPKCPEHGIEVESQSADQIVETVQKMKKGSRLVIMAPMIRGKKGEFTKELEAWRGLGYVRARIDGQMVELEDISKLQKRKTHYIDLVIDRVVVKPEARSRISESVKTALNLSKGFLSIVEAKGEFEEFFSQHAVCPECGLSFPEIEPKLFSFNDPKGACEECAGLGYVDSELEDDEFEDEEVDDELALDTCKSCSGFRLRQEAQNIFLRDKSIGELSELPLEDLAVLISKIEWTQREKLILDKVILNLNEKLQFLSNLGVGYLSLLRPSRTLSGGESQRIRLASQLGSPLIGVLYVLDEPSIGLHPKDHGKLLDSLESLRDRGNTILVVEHDEETILRSDRVIDIGPGAGRLGGEIVSQGTPSELIKDKKSLTGEYLAKKRKAFDNRKRDLSVIKEWIDIKGASGNNLNNIDVRFPLGTFTTVTGVSGSGKSTLVMETLFRNLANSFHDSGYVVQPFKSMKGIDSLDNVVDINQKPIGRTPRSNPATYVGLFSQIRDLFSKLPESRMRGYKPGRFSFNVKGGRCEACQGGGDIKVEMHFMADVYVQCDVCNRQRYNRETLEVKYKGKNIAEVLSMSVNEATDFFENHKMIHRKLDTLKRVGLGYIRLGQSSTTLSGGEAQRVKLSKELSKKGLKKVLYILDEPTTGLHFEDTRKLIELLQELVDLGHTVVVIEHNLDVIKSSDYIVDIGPGGGNRGGHVVAYGAPSNLTLLGESATQPFL